LSLRPVIDSCRPPLWGRRGCEHGENDAGFFARHQQAGIGCFRVDADNVIGLEVVMGLAAGKPAVWPPAVPGAGRRFRPAEGFGRTGDNQEHAKIAGLGGEADAAVGRHADELGMQLPAGGQCRPAGACELRCFPARACDQLLVFAILQQGAVQQAQVVPADGAGVGGVMHAVAAQEFHAGGEFPPCHGDFPMGGCLCWRVAVHG